jgi:hypothetical protein
MAFFAELIFQLLFYGVGWAIGVVVLYVCSWGRIVPTKRPVNANYEYLPTGKIVVKPEIVCFLGILDLFLAIVIWVALTH